MHVHAEGMVEDSHRGPFAPGEVPDRPDVMDAEIGLPGVGPREDEDVLGGEWEGRREEGQ
jgi:hypothetical protein